MSVVVESIDDGVVEVEGAIVESSSMRCWLVVFFVVVEVEVDDGDELSMFEFMLEPEFMFEPEPIDDEPDGVDELLEV